MKSFYTLKKTGLVLMTMLIMLPIANAQVRYKHVPRVKVDARKTEVPIAVEKAVTPPTATASYSNTESKIDIIAQEELAIENTSVSLNTKEIIINKKKTQNVMKHSPIAITKIKSKNQPFGDQIKKESKVFNVSDVKKTSGALSYLLWFFIVLLLCIAFFVLAFIFFSSYFAIYPIFLTIAIVVLVIAAFILIFGLTGMI